ncbi:hypothetical protein OKJ48_43170 [Streptomyces kunmingensis]|uniref:Acyl-CoA carboxylase subunit epsilon n=1 Tax=Streptomyces kunmingensis TaxID=68225 RepID=A0ABU6CSP3_9ACTN|nr:hypothetical protein [Streptomyces kunmingensis]MEB3966991.1 hypothetical protein [Streptomyces kunmingensis]
MTENPAPPAGPVLVDPADLGALLAAAVRPGPDAAGERQALAAFRAVRDAGALDGPVRRDGRVRRRDDWRPGRGPAANA